MTSTPKQRQTNSSEETEDFASQFAKSIKPGNKIGLVGQLGAGKTAFVRGLFLGLGGDPEVIVNSPTFTLIQEYPIKNGKLFHFDLYRLNSLKEFETVDFEEYFETENGVTVVEWADKIPEIKDRFDYWISFEVISEQSRKITITESTDNSFAKC